MRTTRLQQLYLILAGLNIGLFLFATATARASGAWLAGVTCVACLYVGLRR